MPDDQKNKVNTGHSTDTEPDSEIETVGFISLGCPKNLVDSEKMLGLLAEADLTPVSDLADADAIIINTCGFLEAAKEESVEAINQAIEFKHTARCQRVVAAGCLVQRHRAKLLDWCPGLDALVGVFDRDRIVAAVCPDNHVANDIAADLPVYSSIAANATIAKRARQIESQGYFESDQARLRLTPRHYAYLRISEGCNQNCTFCTIPGIRGKMRSKPVEGIVREANELLADGAYELNLIGQDTTSFGADIGYQGGLVGMLEELDNAVITHGGGWIRLMYAYPSRFTDDMIDAMARLSSVVKYIDIPLQHINNQILDNMKRHTSRRLIETLLDKLRRRIPGIAIRTTFISGYPGETDAQHEELVQFVQDFQFDAMGVFPYSPEPGTPAATAYEAGHAIAPEVIDQRIEQLMLAQQGIVFGRNRQMAEANMPVEVLIDDLACEHPLEQVGRQYVYVGRTAQQAPEVDNVTYVVSEKQRSSGELVDCVITDCHEYDLIATVRDVIEPSHSLTVLG